MNQEQRIEKAKWCGLCLSSLFLSLIVLIWAIWTDCGLVSILTLCSFVFLLYQALVMDAYSTFAYALFKYLKCTRLHRFLEEKRKKSALYQLWESTDTHQLHPLRRYDEVHNREGTSRAIQGRDEASEVSHKKQAMRLYRNKDRPVKKEKGKVPQLSGEKNLEKFEAANKAYKESTLRALQEKGINKQRLEQICMLVKSNYSKKVNQLLELSEENENAIIALAEEHFEIKVMAADQKIPEKLQPVSMDDLVKRLTVFQLTQCLPWTPKSSDGQACRKVTHALKELVEWRLKIDDTLCPYAQLTQGTREKLIGRLERQLDQEKPERDLLFLLFGLFNENIKSEEYKLKVRMMGEQVGGLQIIESWVGERYHVDLQMTRQQMHKVYHVKPGEDNIWFALGIAAELYRLKI